MQQKDRLFFLFQKYVDGNLTHEEQTELASMLAHDRQLEDTFRQLQYLHAREMKRMGHQLLDKRKAWRRISRHMEGLSSRRPWRWVAVAAGLALLVVSASLLGTDFFPTLQNRTAFESTDDTKGLSVNDSMSLANMYALQVTNRALLTTSDGGMVRLVSHKRNDIVTSDGQIIGRNIGDRLIYTKPSSKALTCTISVPEGSTYKLSLCDGTSVTLNSGSELTYTIGTETVRDVRLLGEAYFEVTHSEGHPFVVECYDGTLVRDVGTKFNVSARKGQDMTVTVSEGAVDLPRQNKQLSAGCQWKKTEGGAQTTSQVNPDPYISWVSGIYEFKDVELDDILSQLSIWYDVRLHYDTPALRHVKFTGTIFKYEQLGYTLDLLQRVANVHFTLRGGTVIIGQ